MYNGEYLPSDSSAETEEENGVILLPEETADSAGALNSVSAMQAAVCIAVVAILAAFIYLVPDTGNELLSLLRKLTSQPDELFRNPLTLLLERFGILC